jgi:prophage regulatory protein
MEKVAMSKPTIYRLIKGGHFPRQIRVGGNSLWVEDEIDRWIAEKMQGRL